MDKYDKRIDDSKVDFKPGNMLYPLPAVLVGAENDGVTDLITVAWTGTVCTNPPMLSISIRPTRYSYDLIKKSKVFSVNIMGEDYADKVDYCGVVSGRDVDKWNKTGLTMEHGKKIKAPLVGEALVQIECKVKEIIPLGSHTMFLARVIDVHVSRKYMDKNGRFSLEKGKPFVYSHGQYFSLGHLIGRFGYSVKKKGKKA